MASTTGAAVIAQSLSDLGITVIFGIVGIPVVEIADEAIKRGIRFLAFRNEQAASYAATAYGYLTRKPGVCLVVGGPGVLHAMAGIGNSTANSFPLLLLAGSCERESVGRGAFQEMDALQLLRGQVKAAFQPQSVAVIPAVLSEAHSEVTNGVPGPVFIDLPADLIQAEASLPLQKAQFNPPKRLMDPTLDRRKLSPLAEAIRNAKAPLLVFGKGTAYGRASSALLNLVDKAKLLFLPTPMGKGVLPDSHPMNTSSARSAALAGADLVLIFGARLNWILHFGDPPKWSRIARFVYINIDPSFKNDVSFNSSLSICADAAETAAALSEELGNWAYDLDNSSYLSAVQASKTKNETAAAKKLDSASQHTIPMSYVTAFAAIKRVLHASSPPSEGRVVYVSEGANTMDISRSVFPVEHPLLRLDAGTHATMGVGPGYAIAAHAVYNPPSIAEEKRKKIVCLEGDSAFGFSLAELETMSRYQMDILIFVMNNGGVYHGDADGSEEWEKVRDRGGLRATSLGFETRYDQICRAVGGEGWMVKTVEDLEDATRRGLAVKDRPTVVNVIIESGKEKGGKLEFGWQNKGKETVVARGGKAES